MTRYDYIIVGAGSAGCVLANRLTDNPATTVLLLEAGGPDKGQEVRIPAAFVKLLKSDKDWDYTAEGARPDQKQYWPRGKMLGGSSSMNVMMYVRGNPADYDCWESLGNQGWSYRDVLPYFKKSEHQERGASQFHGVGGPLNIADLRSPSPLSESFVQGGVEVGLAHNDDTNGTTQDGIGLTQVTQKNGQRWSSVDAYLKPAMKRSNLTVQTYAHTTRILIEDNRAIGVEYVQDGATLTASAKREVLLCGGAVNSPQLLMLSGIGPAEHLQQYDINVVRDMPGVGQNLQDHPTIGVSYECTQPITLIGAEQMKHIVNYLLFKKGPLTSNGAEAVAFIRTRPDLAMPDVELIFLPIFFMNHGMSNPDGHGMSIGSTLLRPQSRGQITLQTNDPFKAPSIQANYLACQEDVTPLIEGVKFARRIFNSEAFAPYRGHEVWPGKHVTTDEQIVQHIFEHIQSTYHPVGTCKMGQDSMAVVDEQLRVRGIDGLRVVDASIMPTLIGGHTHAPVVMIAEKAADFIFQ